jgi:HAD superfamily hydrolase (TIGR01509 family)
VIPHAVFFDMDGTLIDSEPIWYECEKDLMAEFDYNWTRDDQKSILGGPLKKVGRIMSEKARGVEDPNFFMASLISLVSLKFESKLQFMPGALELLYELGEIGIPTALVTASPNQLAQATLTALEGKYFSVVVTADDVKNTKPDPECYLLAASLLGVDVTNCLVLEDTNTGVTAGESSGAWVVAIPHLAQIESRARVKVIDTLAGLSVEELFSLH